MFLTLFDVILSTAPAILMLPPTLLVLISISLAAAIISPLVEPL